MPEQAGAKRDGVRNLYNYNLNQFLNTENYYALKTLRMNRSRP